MNFKHANNLPEAVMEEIRPIFKDLARTELLKKCEQGKPQKANESVNNLVWKYCPKEKHHGLTTVETSVAIAVCIFNDGCNRLGQILEAMGINAGEFATTFFAAKDTFPGCNSPKTGPDGNKGVQKEKEAEETWQR